MLVSVLHCAGAFLFLSLFLLMQSRSPPKIGFSGWRLVKAQWHPLKTTFGGLKNGCFGACCNAPFNLAECRGRNLHGPGGLVHPVIQGQNFMFIPVSAGVRYEEIGWFQVR